MKREERMRVTAGKEVVAVIRKIQGRALATCPPRGRRVGMAMPEQAVTLTGIGSRTIHSRGERIHFIETTEAQLLVGLGSPVAAPSESG